MNDKLKATDVYLNATYPGFDFWGWLADGSDEADKNIEVILDALRLAAGVIGYHPDADDEVEGTEDGVYE